MSTRTRAPFGVRIMAPLLLVAVLNPLNSAMLATALIAIGNAFPGQEKIGGWLVASLYLSAAVAQPALGSIADSFGARRTLNGSLVVLALGAILGTFANDMPMLIVSRVMIGFGTSGAFPCAVAIIRHRADKAGIETPTRLLGMLAAASATSVAIAPPLGGLITELLGWHGVFSINLPLAIVAIVLIRIFVPPDDARVETYGIGIDWLGIGLFTGFMTAFVFVFMHLSERLDLVALGFAVVLLPMFILAEKRSKRPFVDMKLLKSNRPLSLTYVNHLVFNFVNYCFFYSVPQWSQKWLGLSIPLSGLVLMPVALSSGVAALAPTRGRSGRIVEIVGVGAFILTNAALILLNNDTTIAALMALTFVFGLSYGILNMSNQQRLLDYAPLALSGSAAGLLRTSAYVGAILSAPLVSYAISGSMGDLPLRSMALLIMPLTLVPAIVVAMDIRKGRGAN